MSLKYYMNVIKTCKSETLFMMFACPLADYVYEESVMRRHQTINKERKYIT